MRPERLELSGFTAFREPTEVDFHGVDLFALTGPTGSGKSSVIDAIVFALYGSVPRYGDRRTVEPVISLGKVEARVRFDFTVGDEQYSAVRVVRRQKRGAATKEARLERDGETLASTADRVTAEVEKLLGLSYDHFVKSVVLPQGKFAAFLHDKPTDRQKLLRELLDLGIYEQVRERAHDRRVAAQQRAEILDGQIGELAYATEEAETEAARRVEILEGLLKTVEGAEQEIGRLQKDADAWAEKARTAKGALELLADIAIPDGLDELATTVEELSKDRAAGVENLKAAQIARQEAEENLLGLPKLAEVDALLGAHQDVAAAQTSFEALKRQIVEAEGELAEAAGALESAKVAFEAARSTLADLRHAHAAHEIASGLHAGDECPVCGNTVEMLPGRETPADLDAAIALFERSEQTYLSARDRHTKAVANRERLDTVESSTVKNLERLRAAVDSQPHLETLVAQRQAVVAAEVALQDTRVAENQARKALDEVEARRSGLSEDLKEAHLRFDRTRDRVAALLPPEPARLDLRADWGELVTWAQRTRVAKDEAAKEAADKATGATTFLEERWRTLLGIVTAAGLDVGDRPARDVCVDALATARLELERVRAAREKAAKLAGEVEEQRTAAAVAAELEKHLRSNRFEAWLLEEALAALTIGANRLLTGLSSGAYSIEAKGREFTVVDHRNADERRPVKTLSGGETFLVSLALALSLSEQLAAMSLSGNVRLESIFLDEGFGTLDEESLDVVASVVHELGATGRTVGLVSHVRDLAEQVPVRYLVTKDATTARVERIDA